jgi:copper chaperone
MTAMIYHVTGMTCEHCARAVTSEIESLDGVSAVSVALVPGGESAVTVTSSVPLTPRELATALDEAGDYQLA